METLQKNNENDTAWSNTSLLNSKNLTLYTFNRKDRSGGGMALAANKEIKVWKEDECG